MGRVPTILCYLLLLLLATRVSSCAQARDAVEKGLAKRIDASPLLSFIEEPFKFHSDSLKKTLGSVSGVAIGRNGLIYIIQRGQDAEPILVFNQDGSLVRSWGRGDFVLPHSLRIDPNGNVWALDAGASKVIEYSFDGAKLLTISLQPIPDTGSPFRGATDLAFSPEGHILVTDGYGNARVLEYTAKGELVREWGGPGAGPGQFHLPHAIQISSAGTVYIADRENGRIELFTRTGKYLRTFGGLGRCYALALHRETLWVAMGPRDQDPGSPGWLIKMDARDGRILGHLFVPEQRSGHAIAISPSGEILETVGKGLLMFLPADRGL